MLFLELAETYIYTDNYAFKRTQSVESVHFYNISFKEICCKYFLSRCDYKWNFENFSMVPRINVTNERADP